MAKLKFGLKILLGVSFIVAGVLHFVNPAFYLKMMPSYLPAPAVLVALSGVTEILAGALLLIPSLSRWGAWWIIAHLLVFFTVHVWMIQRADDLYKDLPRSALWVRLVLQFVLIAWAAWYVRPEDRSPATAE